ncbi:MAG: hypothetical protein D6803_00915 [Anaerolineae bacterium]|nr:MAG: hypothetical protein D6803_00915 [Anaerolineae bacterium]
MRLVGRLGRSAGLARGVALMGALLYALRAWGYAHRVDTVLDEGLYLLKGYLFAAGEYRPFQEYGLWTNHMPLSFYIPGFVQVLFRPGLDTGRYFAFALSLLFMLGVWLTVRRWRGEWMAALAVVTLALYTSLLQNYALATSQGLVACLLVWILYLVLDEGASRWQVVLGAALAAVLGLTRLNMAPVLFLLLVFIFWQHDRVTGFLATGVGLLIFLGVHLYYAPAIWGMWVKWFPPEITPFLDRWRIDGVLPWPRPTVPLLPRLSSLFQGYYLHFVPLMGVLAAWLLWPLSWRAGERRKAIFLSGTFVFLFLIHAWASLGGKHCVYCFSGYLFFFDVMGLLLLALTLPRWRLELSRGRALLAWGAALIGAGALLWGYVSHFGSGAQTALDALIRDLLDMPLPRLSGGKVLPGTVPLWGLVFSKFGLLERYSFDVAMQWLDLRVRAIFLALGMSLILLAMWRLPAWLRARRVPFPAGGGGALALLLLAGWLLAPVGLLGRKDFLYACDHDVIADYRAAAAHLAAQVPEETLVYWQGSDSQVALLALPRARFFPPQLNADFSLRVGDADTLLRYGFWNDELAARWQREADVILIEERQYGGGLAEYVTSGAFEEVAPAPPIGCRAGMSLHIYRRLP